MDNKKIGPLGETIAADFLTRKGFKVIARNYRKPWGEIDIIAEKGGIVRFVEVKTISREMSAPKDSTSHQPEDLVDHRKLQKIARTGSLYMENTGDSREYQIDVVGVILDIQNRRARCRLLEQAL